MKNSVLNYLENNKQKFESQLIEWLKIPSVSADSAYKNDVVRAAQFIEADLKSIGFKTELVKTAGHPLVYAEWLNAPGKPTILFYGHYDVQPTDPLSSWTSPPFEPVVRDGNVYARGASDDKGQLFTHIKAMEAWLKTEKTLPLNVKFILEGEEESGGNSLGLYINSNKDKLRCDYVVVSDSGQFGPDIPAITYGLRGIASLEFVLEGPKQDLHSGGFGGAVANPGNNLATIIASLHDKNRKIQIPGFYDDVVPLADWERKQYAGLPFKEKDFFEVIGVNATFGEDGFSILERKWARPTFDVHGLTCGYQGEGSKTIIPSSASAKVSCRLVPNQKPEKIIAALKSFIEKQCFPGIRAKFIGSHSASAIVFSVESPGFQASVRAIEGAFGRKPVFIREGGSIPIVAVFKKVLGVDTLLLGWGQNDDNIHSPNEKFCLKDLHRGINASARLLDEFVR